MLFDVELQFENDVIRRFTANQRPFINNDQMLVICEEGGGTFMCRHTAFKCMHVKPLEDREDSFRDSKCEANGTS